MTDTITTWALSSPQQRERSLFLARLAEVYDLDVESQLWGERVKRLCPPAEAKDADCWRSLRGYVDDYEEAHRVGRDAQARRLRVQIRAEVTQ